MAPRTPVGVIGVGLMGEVYARRLVAAGFTVIGYDVDPAKNARLANFGAQAGRLPISRKSAIRSWSPCSTPSRSRMWSSTR